MSSSECPTCGREAVYHPQAGFAMAKLCERLVADGYVVADLKTDLLERARNMQAGRGFLSNVELKEPAPTATTQQAIEDLLS